MQQAAAEFHALYTRNTQKKHKTWQDAIVKHKGNKLYIYENDDSNTLLGSRFQQAIPVVGETITIDSYLVELVSLANSPEEKHAQVINGNLPKIENSRPRQPRKRFIPPIRKRASTLTQHIDVADRANDNYENKTDNVVKSSSGGLRSAAELIRQTRAKLLTTDTAQNSTRCQSPTSIVANNISAISKTIKRITVAKQAVAINKKPRCIWKLPSQPTTIMSLYFPPDKPCDRFPCINFRQITIPDKFKSNRAYLITMCNAVLECVQIQICEMAKRIRANRHLFGDEAAMRKLRIPFYSEISLSAYATRSHLTNERCKKFLLKLQSRENSSAYTKDDVWVVGKDSSLNPHDTILIRSTWHNPNNTNSLEVIPLNNDEDGAESRKLIRLLEDKQALFAIRICNSSSELVMRDRIVDLLEDSPEFPLLGFLTGSSLPADLDVLPSLLSGTNIPEKSIELAAEYLLNNDQLEIMQSFIKSLCNSSSKDNPPVTLCHGVFGAGKSYFLAVLIIILHQLLPDIKILFSSNTNVAVDRVLQTLKSLGFHEFVRVGSLKKISKQILPYTVQNQNTNEDIEDLQRMLREPLSESDRSDIEDTIRKFKADGNANILNDAFIVGATCLSTAYSLLTREIVPAQSANPFLAAADSGEMISALRPKCRFQIVILDESSQITEPLSLLPLAHFGCERLLLVGDPQQLPPTVPNGARWLGHPIPGGDDTHYGLERTLFERLAKCGIQPIMLSTQYRCHPHIGQLASTLFYQNRLKNGVEVKDREPLAPQLAPLTFVNVQNGKTEKSSEGSYWNEQEFMAVKDWVRRLVEEYSIDLKSIGVISLFKSQVSKIRAELTSAGMSEIMVSTVDAFQGGEREIILLSTVNSFKSTGFMEDSRRLNVAITRARRHLILFGNVFALRKSAVWRTIIDHCRTIDN